VGSATSTLCYGLGYACTAKPRVRATDGNSNLKIGSKFRGDGSTTSTLTSTALQRRSSVLDSREQEMTPTVHNEARSYEDEDRDSSQTARHIDGVAEPSFRTGCAAGDSTEGRRTVDPGGLLQQQDTKCQWHTGLGELPSEVFFSSQERSAATTRLSFY